MKFKVHMKDPDSLYDGIHDAVSEWSVPGVTDEEMRALRETRKESVRSIAAKWFEYGEYLTVEIDTEAQTCVVVPVKS